MNYTKHYNITNTQWFFVQLGCVLDLLIMNGCFCRFVLSPTQDQASGFLLPRMQVYHIHVCMYFKISALPVDSVIAIGQPSGSSIACSSGIVRFTVMSHSLASILSVLYVVLIS